MDKDAMEREEWGRFARAAGICLALLAVIWLFD